MPKPKRKVKPMNQLQTYKSVRKPSIPSTKVIKDKSKCPLKMRRNWNNKGEHNV